MFAFIRVDLVVVSLHSYGNSKKIFMDSLDKYSKSVLTMLLPKAQQNPQYWERDPFLSFWSLFFQRLQKDGNIYSYCLWLLYTDNEVSPLLKTPYTSDNGSTDPLKLELTRIPPWFRRSFCICVTFIG